MRMNNKQNALIQLNGENIRETDKFTYLGSIVSKDGGADNNVKTVPTRQDMHSTPSVKFGIQKQSPSTPKQEYLIQM